MRSAIALAVAVALAVLGQRAFAQQPLGADGWLFTAGAVVLAVYAFAQLEERSEKPEAGSEPPSTRWRVAAATLALLALSANGYTVYRLWHRGYTPPLAWIWAGSLVAIVAAAWLWSGFRVPSSGLRVAQRNIQYPIPDRYPLLDRSAASPCSPLPRRLHALVPPRPHAAGHLRGRDQRRH